VEPKAQVGANIKRERKRLKLTQEEAAHKTGLHPVEFARAERGERDMRVSTVARLARGLGIEATALFRGVK
jgi:transcriptional regulator with XRE-family HTH domain